MAAARAADAATGDGAVDGLLVNHKQFTASSNKQLTSKFRGVCWNKKNRRWQAAINSAGKYLYLGSFTDELDAARQFDRAAIKIRGKKAKLNFPNGEYVDADGNLLEELELPKPAAASVKGSVSRPHTIRTSTSSGSGGDGASGSTSGSGSPCQPRRRCSSPGPSSKPGDVHASSSSMCPIPAFKFGPFASCQMDATAAPMPGLRHCEQPQLLLLAGSGERPEDLSGNFAGLSSCSSLAPAATALGHGGSASSQQAQQGIADQAALMLVQRGWSEATAAGAAAGLGSDDDLLGLAPPVMRSNTVTTSLQLPASFTQQLQPSWQQRQQDVWRGVAPDAALDCFVQGRSGGGPSGVNSAAERNAKPTVARLLELEVGEAAAGAAAAAAAATAAAATDDMAFDVMSQFQLQPANSQVQHWEWPQLQGQQSTGVASLMPSGCTPGGSGDMSGALSHSNSLVTTSLQVPRCCTDSQARLAPQFSGLGSGSSSSSSSHTNAAAAAAAAAAGAARQTAQLASLAADRRLARSLSGPAAAARASNQQQPQPFAAGGSTAGPELRRSVSDGRAASQASGSTGWAVADGMALGPGQQAQLPSAGSLSCPLPTLSSRLASCDLSEAFQLARQAAAEQGISDLATALQKMNQGRAAGEQHLQAQLLQQQTDGGAEQLLRRASKRARQSGAGGFNMPAPV